MVKGSWSEFNDPSIQNQPNSIKEVQDKSMLKVRVKLIRVGRGGKTVTLISGLGNQRDEVKLLLKKLKSNCSTGGTFKEDSIELQGDHVNIALRFLEIQGYKPKRSGG